jgi:hypothetical protein
MNKDMIIRLLSGLSLATINALTTRDNGIGAVKFKGVEGFNELFKIRKSIVDEKIALRLKDKPVSLHHKSFLGMISNDVINTNSYDKTVLTIDGVETNLTTKLADLVEYQLLLTKDGFIPMVNQLAAEVETAIASVTKSNIQNDFNLIYRNFSSLLNILVETEEIGAKYDTMPGGLNYRFPAVTTVDEVKEYSKINNPLIQAEIDKIFAMENDSYWVDLYNAVYGNLTSNNKVIADMKNEKMLNANKNIIMFLIARNYLKGIPFTLDGNKADIVYNVRVLKEYISDVLLDTISISKTLSDSKTIIVYNKNKTIIVDKALMEDGIDADVLIAAAMEGYSSLSIIQDNRDILKAKYNQMNELFVIAEANKLSNTYRQAYMNTFDTALKEDPIYSTNRLKFSQYIYSKDIDELKIIKKVISKVLLKTKFLESNVDFITDKMKDHARASNGDVLDFNSMSEYIALELICEYLVNTHIVTE